MESVSKLAQPFFTIVIPTLDEERYLPHLLSDLAAQTYKDFAVIIVDAKSEDKTVFLAKNFKNSFKSFSIIQSPEKNVSLQRNIGAKKSKSDWIIFMDADNRIPKYFLQGIKFQLEMQNPDILTSWLKPDTKDKKDEAVATIINIFMDLPKASKNPFLQESFVCAKKISFGKLGGFNQDLLWGEGNDLVKRAIKKRMKYVIIKEPKYVWSFRRLRKKGTFKTFRNTVHLEIMNLMNEGVPKEKAKYLYPMGGKYYEIDEKKSSKFRSSLQKLFKSFNSG